MLQFSVSVNQRSILLGCPQHSVCALVTFMTCASKGSLWCGRHKGRAVRDKGRRKKSPKQTDKQIRGRGGQGKKGTQTGFFCRITVKQQAGAGEDKQQAWKQKAKLSDQTLAVGKTLGAKICDEGG